MNAVDHKAARPANAGQWFLVGLGLACAGLLLVLPLALIFARALEGGWAALVANLGADFTLHAIGLTLLATAITVPVNLVFGILLAWCVTHYDFRGRRLLTTLVDIPYATSPVVAGLCYLVVYGLEGTLGKWLYGHGVQVVFAWPGIVLVTIFVTAPYVARILIPLMQSQGSDEEMAALTLGASGWQVFRRVTLPNIRWALLYGVVVTNARAVGEFGAVSVVSGTIMNQTLTLPLLVEQLNNDYKTAAAFSAAALLACMAMVTLVVKNVMEWRQRRRERAPLPGPERPVAAAAGGTA
jgi:sulfate transport system permease protein